MHTISIKAIYYKQCDRCETIAYIFVVTRAFYARNKIHGAEKNKCTGRRFHSIFTRKGPLIGYLENQFSVEGGITVTLFVR